MPTLTAVRSNPWLRATTSACAPRQAAQGRPGRLHAQAAARHLQPWPSIAAPSLPNSLPERYDMKTPLDRDHGTHGFSFLRVQQEHRALELAGCDRGPGIERAVDRGLDRRAVGQRPAAPARSRRRPAAESPSRAGGRCRCAAARSPCVPSCAAMSRRPLWPAMPPPNFIFASPGRRSSSSCTTRISSGVMREEARRGGDRPARQIHVGHRLQQPKVAGRLGDLALELAFAAEGGAELRGKRVDEPEPRIVARARVLAAGIAKARDETDRRHGVSAAHRRRC